ncbi:carboxypeptidase-like regulatory domain-containing protein [Spirosoma aerolatum]|uniref:carboxypeptidase-like regulatory domain-containing protein n=1 Tax=Spirosoma aerolatum TaxID=1211326 RepID=UPI0009AC30E2|nr:carboxypeptidase-like regulatory domain-containing protein [Spirosoma aerolatum]
MLAKRIQLTIQAPCQQSWQDMKPDEGGRFCMHCEKTVVDFTAMTDQQIASIMAQTTNAGCGRFRQSQLNRSLRVSAPAPQAWGRFWGLLTAGLLGYQAAQSESITPLSLHSTLVQTSGSERKAESPEPESLVSADSTRIVSGRVVDEASNTAACGATVLIKELGRGTHVDKDGNFQLLIPDDHKLEHLTLQVTFIGYITQEIRLMPTSRNSLDIRLNEDTTALGEVVMVGGYKRATFWQRLRNRFRSRH